MAEATKSDENKKVIWQSRKGLAEKRMFRLVNELRDRVTGDLIALEKFISPNAVGQYVIKPESPSYDEEVKMMAKIAKKHKMIQLKMLGKDGELIEEGTLLPEVLPPDPKREVEEQKAVVSAQAKRIAELEALIEKFAKK